MMESNTDTSMQPKLLVLSLVSQRKLWSSLDEAINCDKD